MTVFITDYAWETLQSIYTYYTEVAPHKADEIADNLVQRTEQLKDHPLSGPVEPFYARCGFNYRFLVQGNYKIIYKVEGDVIYIMRFFDARQDSAKMLIGEMGQTE